MTDETDWSVSVNPQQYGLAIGLAGAFIRECDEAGIGRTECALAMVGAGIAQIAETGHSELMARTLMRALQECEKHKVPN